MPKAEYRHLVQYKGRAAALLFMSGGIEEKTWLILS
jgi:hypothetical protein